MEHLGTVTLETKRTILRKFELSDAQKMYENWANDDDVTKFLTWQTYKSVQDGNQILNLWIENYKEKNSYQWLIELKEIGEPIGSIGVVSCEDDIKAIEIGYCIGKKFWHQGIVSEVLKELVRFFFEEVKVNRISAKHDVNNPHSGQVMQKAGLKLEGIHLQSGKNNTGICDLAVYGLIAEDYVNISEV